MPRRALDEFDRKLGRKIKITRMANGMSRVQLAKLMQISHQQLRKYEEGKDGIRISTIRVLAKIFRVSVAFFTDETEVLAKNMTHQIIGTITFQKFNALPVEKRKIVTELINHL